MKYISLFSCVACLFLLTSEAQSASRWLPDTDFAVSGSSSTQATGSATNYGNKTCASAGLYTSEEAQKMGNGVKCSPVTGTEYGNKTCYRCECPEGFNLTCEDLRREGLYCNSSVFCKLPNQDIKFHREKSSCKTKCCEGEVTTICGQYEGEIWTREENPGCAMDEKEDLYVATKDPIDKLICPDVICSKCTKCPDGYKRKNEVTTEEGKRLVYSEEDSNCAKLVDGECEEDAHCGSEGEVCIKGEDNLGYCKPKCPDDGICPEPDGCHEGNNFVGAPVNYCAPCSAEQKLCDGICITKESCCSNDNCKNSSDGFVCMASTKKCGCKDNTKCPEGKECSEGKCIDKQAETCPQGSLNKPTCNLPKTIMVAATISEGDCYICDNCSKDEDCTSTHGFGHTCTNGSCTKVEDEKEIITCPSDATYNNGTCKCNDSNAEYVNGVCKCKDNYAKNSQGQCKKNTCDNGGEPFTSEPGDCNNLETRGTTEAGQTCYACIDECRKAKDCGGNASCISGKCECNADYVKVRGVCKSNLCGEGNGSTEKPADCTNVSEVGKTEAGNKCYACADECNQITDCGDVTKTCVNKKCVSCPSGYYRDKTSKGANCDGYGKKYPRCLSSKPVSNVSVYCYKGAECNPGERDCGGSCVANDLCCSWNETDQIWDAGCHNKQQPYCNYSTGYCYGDNDTPPSTNTATCPSGCPASDCTENGLFNWCRNNDYSNETACQNGYKICPCLPNSGWLKCV